jgi:hypothetical protein
MLAENRIVPVLLISKNTPEGWSVKAKAMGAGMLASPSVFVSPTPTPAQLGAAAQAVDMAQGQVALRTKGASEARNLAWLTLKKLTRSSVVYVQGLCDAAPDAEHAVAICAAATLGSKKVAKRVKAVLAAALTTTPGTVALVANASLLVASGTGKAKQRTYLWRYTINGGQAFVNADPTPVAHTEVAGLPLNTSVGFQVAAKDSKGTGPWSQTVTVFVH